MESTTLAVADVPLADLRKQLRDAVPALTRRRLKNSVRWATELLVGLPPVSESTAAPAVAAASTPTAAASAAPPTLPSTVGSPGSPSLPPSTSVRWTGASAAPAGTGDADADDADVVLLAQSYLDANEFKRCHNVLRSTGAASPVAFFLCHYAQYLDGEQHKEDELREAGDEAAPLNSVVNPELKPLHTKLSAVHAAGGLDAFGLYLFGVVLRELGHADTARTVLCQAVQAFPWNWSAWLDLASMCHDRDVLLQLPLPLHWPRDFFMAHVLLELQSSEEAHGLYVALSERFPTSPYVQAQIAQALYNQREFDEAQKAYANLFKADPYRLEDMDTYSNILYVKEDKAVLSTLAHQAMQLDKFRPETCCVVGNYYSLRAEHEKAVLYFRRALRLNRRYLSAWTLMGHEYVEMKNAGAAIEAYRRAVDINPLDYRAWYSLGQTYELLRMFLYALHYYRKATTLRPYDPRMWCAMAGCYEDLDRIQDAIKSYERANSHADREGIATLKLAKLYRSRGDATKAAACYREHLQRQEAEGGNKTSVECAQAKLFLANYAKAHRRLDEAEKLASDVLSMPWPQHLTEARALLRELRSMASTPSFFPADPDMSGFSSVMSPGMSPFTPAAARGTPQRVTPIGAGAGAGAAADSSDMSDMGMDDSVDMSFMSMRSNRSARVTPVSARPSPRGAAVTPVMPPPLPRSGSNRRP